VTLQEHQHLRLAEVAGDMDRVLSPPECARIDEASPTPPAGVAYPPASGWRRQRPAIRAQRYTSMGAAAMHQKPLMDVGLTAIGLVVGALWAGLGFVVAVFLEAFLMGRYLHTAWRRSLWYSFLMNLASAILGIPVIMIITRFLPLPLVILLAFVLTLPVEFICLRLVIKPTPPGSTMMRFVAFANLASYFCVLVVPWAGVAIGLLRGV
jgi:hypothetical protein